MCPPHSIDQDLDGGTGNKETPSFPSKADRLFGRYFPALCWHFPVARHLSHGVSALWTLGLWQIELPPLSSQPAEGSVLEGIYPSNTEC